MRKEMVFSVILAICVVTGGVWIADRSLTTNATGSPAAPISPQSVSRSMQTMRAPEHAPERAPERAPDPQPQMSHGISKCVLDGQTIYSDRACPKGASQQELVLYDSAGIEDKSREQLAAIRSLKPPVVRTEILSVQHASHPDSSQASRKKSECEALNKQIEWMDAAARQAQSPSSMDRIREKRKKVRDRQYALRC